MASFHPSALFLSRSLSLSLSLSPSLPPSLSLPLPPQPILNEAVLDQYRENKSSVPPGMTPDKYLEVTVSYIDYYRSILCSPHLLDLLP